MYICTGPLTPESDREERNSHPSEGRLVSLIRLHFVSGIWVRDVLISFLVSPRGVGLM
jgi:hypothetical protein